MDRRLRDEPSGPSQRGCVHIFVVGAGLPLFGWLDPGDCFLDVSIHVLGQGANAEFVYGYAQAVSKRRSAPARQRDEQQSRKQQCHIPAYQA